MNILGIDTTTKSASCSILYNNEYFTKNVSNEITHSEKLLPIIHETLKESNTSLDNINLLAAINGPGSFTGIRIGLATIKAFSQVKLIDIYSISSIDLISYVAFKNSNSKEKLVLSIIDARNNRVYYGINKLSKADSGKITIENICDIQNDLIEDVVNNIKYKDILVAGNCVDNFKDILSNISSELINLYPTTEDLIDSYLHIENTSKYMFNAYNLDATYARESQAERMSK